MVIWALSILIVLSVVFGASTAAHLKATRNAIDNARAEALADAGIELAVLDRMRWRATNSPARFPRDGRPVACSMAHGDRLVIAVEDEVGKVDLNMGDEGLVAAALRAAGMDQSEAARLAARILDYSDSDSLRRADGAEAVEYDREGLAGPKNRPLDAIEEVEQVLGAPQGLAEALASYATIYSGQRAIDRNFAAPRLVAALAGGGALAMDLADTSRMEGGLAARQTGPSAGAAAGGAGGRAFRIVAEAQTVQGAVFVREAVLDFTGTGTDGYTFRRWRRGSRLTGDGGRAEEALAAADAQPC
jgi:general secretion pathway protein K